MQQVFIIKAIELSLQKGIEDICLNIIKVIYDKFIVRITINSETLEVFLKNQQVQKHAHSCHSMVNSTRSPSQSN
jgi:hypothetical protein